MSYRPARWLGLTLTVVAALASPGFSQSIVAGTAKNANGALSVVRVDGVETRLQGRGSLPVFEGDLLRVEGGGALIETAEGIQVALNGNAVVKILARWDQGIGITRILRVQRGEVWARSNNPRQPVEVETPVGVLAARAAEISLRLASDDEAVATVVSGTADFSNPFSSCRLSTGTVSTSYRGKPCTAPTVVDVRSVVGWSHALLVP